MNKIPRILHQGAIPMRMRRVLIGEVPNLQYPLRATIFRLQEKPALVCLRILLVKCPTPQAPQQNKRRALIREVRRVLKIDLWEFTVFDELRMHILICIYITRLKSTFIKMYKEPYFVRNTQSVFNLYYGNS